MAITINDVAKRAGVSHTTVSWVIHNDSRITQKTKDKVKKAIEELNYHPNYNARSLVKGKTDVIAVVTSFFSTYFELSVLRGIENAIGKCEKTYNLNLFSSSDRIDETLNEILYGRRADAVILLSDSPSQKIISSYIENKIPLILVENYHDELISVKSNNIAGTKEAIDYLFSIGKKKIGIIVEELNDKDIPGLSQVERMMGFEESHKEHGTQVDKELIFSLKLFRMEVGREVAQKIVNENIDVDAIFCAAGDKVALGLIDELKKLGKSIPEDCAVIGFDDIDVAELVSPSLSTVRQDLYGLGETAYNLAVKAISGENIAKRHIQFDTQLIKRESTIV
ncbi:MAG: LacI family transcriptional regulator [Spirochaetaceae bacterium]